MAVVARSRRHRGPTVPALARVALAGVLAALVGLTLACTDDDEPEVDDDEPEAVEEPEEEEPAEEEPEDPAPEEDVDVAEGDVLHAALQSAPEALDPHLATTHASFQVLENVYDTLVEPDGDGGFAGALAREWEVDDEGTTWRFELREGVTWHDGSAFDADDVVYSLERIADEGRNAFRLADVAEVEAVDELAVRIELERPVPNLLANLGGFKGLAIVPDGAGEELDEAPVGTGPFAVAGETGDAIELEAFDDHWDGAPAVGGVAYRVIASGDERMEALERGEVDWTDRVPARDLEEYRDHDEITVEAVPANAYYYYALNQAREPWDEREVREALAQGFSRTALVEAAELGAADANQTAIPAGDPYHVDHTPFDEDLDAAEELLAEAEVGDLEVDLLAHAGDEGSVRAAEVLAAQWGEIGLDVTVRAEEHAEWLADQADGEFDALLWAWVDNHDPFDYYYTQHHSQGVNNFQAFADEDVDEALEAAQATFDDDERREAYAEAATRIADLASYTYLYNPHRVHAWRDSVDGYAPRIDGALRFDGVSIDRGAP